MSLTPGQKSLAVSVFCDTADQDYLLARGCYRIGLYDQFFWSGAQAIEKYIKCSILINGGNAKGIKHSLFKGYKKLPKNCKKLLPGMLVPPRYFPAKFGRFTFGSEPLTDFVKKFDSFGQPAGRYKEVSHYVEMRDFHKFDELCFQLRRTCTDLNQYISSNGPTHYKVLSTDKNWQPRGSLVNWTGNKDEKRKQESILRWRNFSYYEDHALRVGKLAGGGKASNSPYFLLSQYKSEKKSENIRWITENADLGKELESFLESKLS